MSLRRSESTNPYDSPAAGKPQCGSVLRFVVALPFYLMGGFYGLMFLRTPERIHEAWSRHSSGDAALIPGDPLFAESLWRSTVIPLTGVGLLLVAYGISARRRTATLIGATWTFLVFIVGSSLR